MVEFLFQPEHKVIGSDFQTLDILETEGLGRLLLMDGLVMTTEKDEYFYHEMTGFFKMETSRGNLQMQDFQTLLVLQQVCKQQTNKEAVMVLFTQSM